MSKFGIDVSEHQGLIDWEKVKPQIDFAILRIGFGDDIASQDDKYFKINAGECTRLGIPFGVYIYSYALTKEQIKSEVSHTLRQIKGYKLSYPVYFDTEDSSQSGLSNSTLADFSATFCEMIQAFGYTPGVYSFLNWWDNKLTDIVFDKYEKWVAQFNSSITKSQYAKTHNIWQYSSTGRINGINGNVDCNYCYKDFVGVKNAEPIVKIEKADYIIQYSNSVDQAIAEMMADRLNCPTMNCMRPYAYYHMFKTVICVGEGKNKSGYTNVNIQGAGRKETAYFAIEYLESLGK